MQEVNPVIQPWSDPESWDQMKLSLEKTVVAQKKGLFAAKLLAGQIADKLTIIDSHLDSLCRASCTSCNEICCSHATLWFDFRDILYIYLHSGSFPDQQLWRKKDRSCCCLTPTGCSLQRIERPFICTWYLCSIQTKLLRSNSLTADAEYIFNTLREIKKDRKFLEEIFLDALV